MLTRGGDPSNPEPRKEPPSEEKRDGSRNSLQNNAQDENQARADETPSTTDEISHGCCSKSTEEGTG